MFRRIPTDATQPELRICHSLNDEGLRTFRGIAWGLLLGIPVWVGVAWIGRSLLSWLS